MNRKWAFINRLDAAAADDAIGYQDTSLTEATPPIYSVSNNNNNNSNNKIAVGGAKRQLSDSSRTVSTLVYTDSGRGSLAGGMVRASSDDFGSISAWVAKTPEVFETGESETFFRGIDTVPPSQYPSSVFSKSSAVDQTGGLYFVINLYFKRTRRFYKVKVRMQG